MKINVENFGTMILQKKQAAWDALVAAKFQACSPEELEVMHTIWSHGFSKAIEIQSEASVELYASQKSQ